MKNPSDWIIGRKYKIIKVAITGNGFLALDTTLNKEVNLIKYPYHPEKTLTEIEINSFINIRHENIFPPLDTVIENDSLYVVYDHWKWETLEDFIEVKRTLTEEKARDILLQLIAGYKQLVKKNLLHKDIKPKNILLTFEDNPRIKLSRFSISENIPAKKNFVAPEVCIEKMTYTIKSDIWSIGAVLYYMLHGSLISKQHKKDNKYSISKNLSDICLDFLLTTLEYKVSERMSFDQVESHPFISLNMQNNRMDEILSRVEKYRSIYKKMISKFVFNTHYICHCGTKSNVRLNCGDTICLGCFCKIRYKALFEVSHINAFVRIVDSVYENDCGLLSKNYRRIQVSCPICLSFTRVKSIGLRCGCTLKSDNDESKYIKPGYSGERNMICKVHNNRVEFLTELAVYGDISFFFSDDYCNEPKMLEKCKNNFITKLCISSNLRPEAVKAISNNAELEELIVKPYITNYKAIGEILNNNNTLKLLYLESTNLSFDSFKEIIEVLKDNKGLNELHIFSDYNYDIANELGEMLKCNTALTKLYLHGIQYKKEGMKEIMRALRYNKTLQQFTSTANTIDQEGSLSFGRTLIFNNTMTRISLSRRSIDKSAINIFAEYMKENMILTKLCLRDNNISDEGTVALSKVLTNNMVLTELDLSNINIMKGGQTIAEALFETRCLAKLCLENDNITAEIASILAKSIENLYNLQVLNLNCNLLGDKGTIIIANAIRTQEFMTELYLSNNQIGVISQVDLISAIGNIKTLHTLNLGENSIDDSGAFLLSKVIEQNKDLSTVILEKNCFGNEGAGALINSIKKRKNYCKLDISNIRVNESFKTLAMRTIKYIVI